MKDFLNWNLDSLFARMKSNHKTWSYKLHEKEIQKD